MMDPSFRNRALIASTLLVVFLSALSARLLKIQLWDRELIGQSNPSNLPIKKTIPASRGYIMDRNGTVLAQNRPEAQLIADQTHLEHVPSLTRAVAHRIASQAAGWSRLNEAERKVMLKRAYSDKVSKMSDKEIMDEHLDYGLEIIGRNLRVTSETLKKKFSGKGVRVVVQKRIPEDKVREIEKELEECRIQGFSFERNKRRFYSMPTLAPHLVGYVGFDDQAKTWIGKAGIEAEMEEVLAGRDGERTLKRDENRLVSLTEAAKIKPPILGKHVKLTLDIGMQAIVEEILEKEMKSFKAKKGSIIVADPYTGNILAMASRPHYDLNLRKNVETASTSFAVSAQYEAGSVMKIVAMAAALDTGVANRNSTVNCGWGKISRYGFWIRDHHSYGDLTFDGVLVKSSNPGVFQFADMVGQAKFYQYLYDFGFGKKTGFPIPGEVSGRIANPRFPRNFASATYGYSVSVSPLQLAMAYSVLANGGNLMKPRLVDSVIANNGAVVSTTPVTKVRNVIKPRAARDMRLALEQVVLKGTGRKAKVPGHRSCGKTGTALKWDNERGIYTDKLVLTYAGMLPVESPKFVCVVTIDDPTEEKKEEVGGGTVAGPVFSKVASRLANFMNITPSEPVADDGN